MVEFIARRVGYDVDLSSLKGLSARWLVNKRQGMTSRQLPMAFYLKKDGDIPPSGVYWDLR